MSLTSLEEISGWMDEFLWPDQDEKQRAKRERILEAATDLFVRYGYRKTNIDEVARQAGIAKGTVYLYYRNKAELVFHAVALEKRGYLDHLAPVLDDTRPAVERLRTLIVMGLTLSHEMPLLTRLTGGDRDISQAMREIDMSVLARVNEWQTEFTMRLLDEAAGGQWSRTELTRRAQVFIDLIYAITTSGGMVVQNMPVEEHARLMADIIVDGILGPAGKVQGDGAAEDGMRRAERQQGALS